MALKVIFQPVEPKNICGYTLHGIFLKRQTEVSVIFARVVFIESLHIKAIWTAIFNGRLPKTFSAMLQVHTLVFTGKLVAEIEPLAIAAMGSAKFLRMKEDIAQKVLKKMPSVIDVSYVYTQGALDMETTIARESPPTVEKVSHPRTRRAHRRPQRQSKNSLFLAKPQQ
jgi:hypothetical protein